MSVCYIKRRSAAFLAVLVMFFSMNITFAESTVYKEFYVDAVNGSDENTGVTLENAFKTIEAARDAVRKVSDNMTGDIFVYLADGEYVIDKTITFTAEDSGKNGYKIRYTAMDGANPIISGAKKVTDWKLYDETQNIYRAQVSSDLLETRQFYVNGEKAPRAYESVQPGMLDVKKIQQYMSVGHSDNTATETVTIDMKNISAVTGMTLYSGSCTASDGKAAGFPQDFKISYSTDGESYITCFEATGESAPSALSGKTYNFESVNARYLKLEVTRLGNPDKNESGIFRLILSEIQLLSGSFNPDLTHVHRIGGKNKALNASVTMSSSANTLTNPLTNITDGDTKTTAMTSSSRRASYSRIVTLDLGKTQEIGMLRLYGVESDDGYINEPVDFTIDISNDNSVWTTVAAVTDAVWEKGKPYEVLFDMSNTQYIRLNSTRVGHSDSSYYKLELGEIELYGKENLALNKKIIAPNASTFDPSLSPDYLTDGMYSGGYYTSAGITDAAAIDAPVTVDLEEIYDIGAVRLYPVASYGYPDEMMIQASADGVNYENVLHLRNIPNPEGKPQEFVLEGGAKARYVKIIPKSIGCINSNGYYYFQLKEIEVMPYSKTVQPVLADCDYAIGAQDMSAAGADYNVYASSINSEINHPVSLFDGVVAEQGERKYLSIGDEYSFNRFKNTEDMEVHSNYLYHHGIYKISGVTNDNSFLITDRVLDSRAGVTWLENCYEFIDRDGEWYIDKRGTVSGGETRYIYYKAPYGMDMNRAETILPYVEKLISVKGSLNAPVTDIVFSGITFAYSSWTYPSEEGLDDAQAGTYVSNGYSYEMHCAVDVTYSKNLEFTKNKFTNMGSGALGVRSASQNNLIEGNVFCDLSAGAIYVGGIYDHHNYETNSNDVVYNNTVRNNYITRIGTDYGDNAAIFLGYTDSCKIEHNEMYDISYTGITVGWGWGDADAGGSYGYTTDTCAKNNVISGNIVRKSGRTQQDGGMLYALGNQPGTIISGNYFEEYGDPSQYIDSYGIYLDACTKNMTITNNVVGNSKYWLVSGTNTASNVISGNYVYNNSVLKLSTKNTISSNQLICNGNSSADEAAREIASAAGISSDWKYIKDKATWKSVNRFDDWNYVIMDDGAWYYTISEKSKYASRAYGSRADNIILELDLGNLQEVSGLKLYAGSGVTESYTAANFPIDFTILYSQDGEEFYEAARIKDCSAPDFNNGKDFNFSSVHARYIRISATKLGNAEYTEPLTYRMEFDRIIPFNSGGDLAVVYSQFIDSTAGVAGSNVLSQSALENVALNKPVTVSAVSAGNKSAITDGLTAMSHTGTGEIYSDYCTLQTDSSGEAWAIVDLGKEFDISKVVVTALRCNGKKLKLQVSADNKYWLTLDEKLSKENLWYGESWTMSCNYIFDYSAENVRYVRISCNSSVNLGSISVYSSVGYKAKKISIMNLKASDSSLGSIYGAIDITEDANPWNAFWGGINTTGDTIDATFDFGEVKPIKTIYLTPHSSNSVKKNFKVYVSDAVGADEHVEKNDENMVYAQGNENYADLNIATLAIEVQRSGRYVTVSADAKNIGEENVFTLANFEAYGGAVTNEELPLVNIAEGKSVTATGENANNITDGMKESVWYSDAFEYDGAVIDLGAWYNVRKISMTFGEVTQYIDVFGSATGEFGSEKIKLADTGGTMHTKGETVPYDVLTANLVRYIKIMPKQNNNYNSAESFSAAFSLAEIEVYVDPAKEYELISSNQFTYSTGEQYNAAAELADGDSSNGKDTGSYDGFILNLGEKYNVAAVQISSSLLNYSFNPASGAASRRGYKLGIGQNEDALNTEIVRYMRDFPYSDTSVHLLDDAQNTQYIQYSKKIQPAGEEYVPAFTGAAVYNIKDPADGTAYTAWNDMAFATVKLSEISVFALVEPSVTVKNTILTDSKFSATVYNGTQFKIFPMLILAEYDGNMKLKKLSLTESSINADLEADLELPFNKTAWGFQEDNILKVLIWEKDTYKPYYADTLISP